MLLFLDFDGVLHVHGGEKFAHLPRLEAVLRAYPEIEVVLSTSWRVCREFPFPVLRAFFSADLRHRFFGVTPIIDQLEPPFRPHVRHREILLYLRRHTKIAKGGHLILDDDRAHFPATCPELILCDAAIGFDEERDVELRARLALAAAPACLL
jgi:hypothetical protein